MGYERLLGKWHSLGLELAYKPQFDDRDLSFVVLGDNSKQPYMAVNAYSTFLNYSVLPYEKRISPISVLFGGKAHDALYGIS